MNLELTKEALADLESISEYTIKIWGSSQEDKYIDLIYDKLDEIVNFPSSFRHREDLREKCQCAEVGKHVIFFKIEGDLIIVARILHQTMDYQNNF